MSPRTVPVYPPIADYALLSDCHSCALVSTDGSIDWCTFHRFEARPVFGRILDWAKAGFFRIAPLDDGIAADMHDHLAGIWVDLDSLRLLTGAGLDGTDDSLDVPVAKLVHLVGHQRLPNNRFATA